MCSTFCLGFLSNCKKIIIFEFSTEKYFLKGFFFYIFSVEKNVEQSVEKNVEANFRKKKVWFEAPQACSRYMIVTIQ